MRRIPMLDGWRAVSILLVLAGHLLPLAGLNIALASTGLAIFFCLSGFLITQFLLHRPDVVDFLVRRVFRIVPLAWAAMLVLALATDAPWRQLLANLLFVSNVPPGDLLVGGGHLWSLCVEMHFYLGVALLVRVGGRRALWSLPLLALAVTGFRIVSDAPISIWTPQRVDEILAGATVALVVHRLEETGAADRAAALLPSWLPVALVPLVLVSGDPAWGPLAYARPYLASAMVGCSLYAAPALVRRWWCSRPAAYVAEISYALYVVHLMLAASWLGSGGTVEKYLKRPLLLVCCWALAHLSTFYYERPLTRLGKRLTARRGAPRPEVAR